MLLAVLERHGGVYLSDHDVYVSTVGGVRLTEPAADLAIALALGSAKTERPIRGDIAVCGEISLAGEIRPIVQASRRESEARRLGFGTLLGPDLATLRDAVIAAIAPR